MLYVVVMSMMMMMMTSKIMATITRMMMKMTTMIQPILIMRTIMLIRTLLLITNLIKLATLMVLTTATLTNTTTLSNHFQQKPTSKRIHLESKGSLQLKYITVQYHRTSCSNEQGCITRAAAATGSELQQINLLCCVVSVDIACTYSVRSPPQRSQLAKCACAYTMQRCPEL